MIKYYKWILLIILIFTLFSRSLVGIKMMNKMCFEKTIIGRDSEHYVNIAKNLLFKKIYAFGEHPTSIRPPGYPYFLLFNYKFFGVDNVKVIVYEQIIITVFVVFLIFLIGKEFSIVCGLIASLCYAIWYPNWERVGWISTEVLTVFSLTLSTLLLLYGLNKKKNFYYFFSGIAVGISALTRAEILIIPVVFVIVMVIMKNYKIGFFLLGVCLILCPWILRNYIVHGKFLFTTSTGILLFCDQGSHKVEEQDCGSMFFGIKSEEIRKFSNLFDIALTGKEREYDEIIIKEKLNYAINYPLKVLKVLVKNFLIMFYPMGPSVWLDRYDPIYGTIMAFIFIYFIFYFKKEKLKTNILIILLFWLPLLIPYTLFTGDPIYRASYEPILCIIGSYGIVKFFENATSTDKLIRKILVFILLISVNVLLHFIYVGRVREYVATAIIAKVLGLKI